MPRWLPCARLASVLFQESDSLTAVFALECDDSGRLFGDSLDGETPHTVGSETISRGGKDSPTGEWNA